MRLTHLLILFGLSAMWAASFIFIRIAAPVLGPVLLADLRLLIAALVLLAYALAVRRPAAPRGPWTAWLLLGGVNVAVPFVLIGAAELQLTASLAAIINAMTPLFTAVVETIWLGTPFTAKKGTGLALGLTGVAVLVGWSPLPFSWRLVGAVGASVLASVCYGVGGVFARKGFSGNSAITLTIGQQLAGGLLLLPFSLATLPRRWPPPLVVWSALALAVLSTAIGYVIYFWLIARIGPTRTLTVTVLNPLFGLLWGALFLAERPGAGTLPGLALILVSVLLVNDLRLRQGARGDPA